MQSCVCVCACICGRICMCVHVWLHIYVRTCVYIPMCICMLANKCLSIPVANVWLWARTCLCECLHASVVRCPSWPAQPSSPSWSNSSSSLRSSCFRMGGRFGPSPPPPRGPPWALPSGARANLQGERHAVKQCPTCRLKLLIHSLVVQPGNGGLGPPLIGWSVTVYYAFYYWMTIIIAWPN